MFRRRNRQESPPAPASQTDRSAPVVRADNPIRSEGEDTLYRAPQARAFAHHILTLDVSEGAVVGVLGEWGGGKTSFINLARDELVRCGLAIIDYNPWMFSGTPQLVDSFFVELSAQLKLSDRYAAIGKSLEEYGEAFSGLTWLPLVGAWVERGRLAAKTLGGILSRRKEGVTSKRERVVASLASLNLPIVVVIDDIDRLTSAEIREVFKLVRLTASFPNIVYLLAFDRQRVEQALSEEGVPGRAYLEKILQIGIDLPSIPEAVLREQIALSIDVAIASLENPGPFDESAWPDVFIEVIRPLIRNMRDVRRYAVAITGTIPTLEGKLALVDVLALEAIRVFLPDVFGALRHSVDGLTKNSGWERRHEPAHLI